jgi:hypothetical protein
VDVASGGARRVIGSRRWLWVVVKVPRAVLLWGWITGPLTFGRAVAETGHWAA